MESNTNTDTSDNLFKHRKLASVQKISDIRIISDKTQEEIATVIGWKVFVPKNQFKIDEKVIYFEIDSILPANKKWTKKIKPKHLHIQTQKRYNEISQGYVMKLDTLRLNKEEQSLNIDSIFITFIVLKLVISKLSKDLHPENKYFIFITL